MEENNPIRLEESEFRVLDDEENNANGENPNKEASEIKKAEEEIETVEGMIKAIRKKIKTIRYAIPEKYQEYSEKLGKIEEKATKINDDKFAVIQKSGIIKEIVKLENDFDNYMKEGEKQENEATLVLDPTTPKTSGNTKLNEYRIKQYEKICEMIKSSPEVEIARIKQMIEEIL